MFHMMFFDLKHHKVSMANTNTCEVIIAMCEFEFEFKCVYFQGKEQYTFISRVKNYISL